MKYLAPVLCVCGNSEVDLLKHVQKYWYKDYDILVPYEYQRKHFELIYGYIAPDYYSMCPCRDSLEDTIADMESSA